LLRGLENVYFDKTRIETLESLLDSYRATEFASPSRSTVPLLSLIKDGWPQFVEILSSCGLPEGSHLHFEYKLRPPLGKGKASHTDLMVVSEDGAALAIEAKWTEPRYQTVSEWLPLEVNTETNLEDNRTQVLQGWLDLLQPQASDLLKIDNFSGVVYQLVHRAASVCERSDRPKLAYLRFTPNPDGILAGHEDYRADLACLHALLGRPSRFAFYAVEVPIRPTPAFQSLRRESGTSCDLGQRVRGFLLEERLFEFGTPTIEII
jgi:hypothetical protein